VSVIATATNTVVATVPVGGAPQGVAITPAPPPCPSPVVCALNRLRGLVATCRFCPPDPSRWLLDKIDQAMSQVLKGHTHAAVDALQQFVHGTEHFLREGELPVDEGQPFIVAAAALIAQLGGR